MDQPGSGTINLKGGLPVFWGWATLQGVGHICKIDGRIDGELHTSILQDEFSATVGQAGQITPCTRMMTPNTPQEGLKMVPTEQGQYLEVFCTATCQCPDGYRQ